jgi:superfamily II DNA or RNA helicase
MQLRDYQTQAIGRIKTEFKSGVKSTLLVMATGTGKTVTFTQLAKEYFDYWKMPVLVLAHRGELLDQAQSVLYNFGLKAEIEKADRYARSLPHDAVVASVQSLSQPKRLAMYPSDYFGFVIVDEAHHATADTYRRILKHFSGAKILGVTATPNRHDEIGLKNVFETCAFQYSIQDGIRDGYLCPVRGKQVVCEDLKLEQVKVVAGDFSASELEEMLMQESVLQEMVLPTIEHAQDRPTIVFTPSVNHAHAIAGCFNRVREKSATVVDGKMNNETRSQNLKDFEEGKRQFIVNVGVLTEGYDHPPTACIALFRPTRSLGLLAQMIGRGTRICDGKTDCVVLDFVGVDRTVKTMNVLDVLDGSILSEQEKQKALEFQEEGDDAMEALDKAKRFVADLDSIKAKMRALTTSNAFDVLQMFAVPSVKGKYGGDLATLKQREYLIKKGLLVPPTMEKGEASKLIEKFVKRQEQGLATFKQLKYLKSLGYKDNFVETLSFAEAGELIGKMRGASGGR